jgi:predicted metalloprotease with PDZ domain
MPLILIRRGLLTVLLALCVTVATQAAPRIENIVTIADPKSPVLRVATTIKGLEGQPQLEVGIPGWAPGYYITEDFARNISRLVFTDETGRRLRHEKNQDSLWVVETRGASSVKIDFEYAANQLDLNKSIIKPDYAILNGTNFFFYIKGHTLDLPVSVTFRLPPGWSIATALTAMPDPATFTAESYDVLVDCPVLAGEFDLVTLGLHGVPHRLAVAPKGTFTGPELERLAAGYLKLVDAHTGMFGEIPYKQYLIINVFEGTRGVFGALEHLNSYFGIQPRPLSLKMVYNDLISLTSHEFFHVFNVKRIRPAELWPYRYDARNYTRLLWFSEGVTDYYTPRGRLRAGLINEDQYLQEVANVAGSAQTVEAAKYISVEEASINVWIGGITGDRMPFRLDYYSRGSLIGLLLDLSIRHDTKSAHTLDDVLRVLYENYYKKNCGFKTSDLVTEINRLTGRDYQTFFERHVGGTEPLPVDEIFAYAGLRLEEQKNRVPRLGTATSPDRTIIYVAPGSPAEEAGAKLDDIFLSIGPFSTEDPKWPEEFRRAYAGREGETVEMKVTRDGKPVRLEVKIKLGESSKWNLSRLPESTPAQKELLDKWISGK